MPASVATAFAPLTCSAVNTSFDFASTRAFVTTTRGASMVSVFRSSTTRFTSATVSIFTAYRVFARMRLQRSANACGSSASGLRFTFCFVRALPTRSFLASSAPKSSSISFWSAATKSS